MVSTANNPVPVPVRAAGVWKDFGGADVLHLLNACAETLDWSRLTRRFGRHWRVLFAHLTLFGFVYPSERCRIPEGMHIGINREADAQRFHVTEKGRVLVVPEMLENL